MSKVKVPVAGTIGRSVRVNPDATKGATLGVNLYDADGTLLDLTALIQQIVNDALAAQDTATLDEPALAVSPSPDNITRTIVVSGTAYAILEFNTSGAEFANASGGSTAMTHPRGSWLVAGTSAEVWVERVLDSGTLNYADPGAGRLQLNTTRTYGISRTITGIRTTTVTFNFYDAASGGNLLGSATIVFTAEVDDV